MKKIAFCIIPLLMVLMGCAGSAANAGGQAVSAPAPAGQTILFTGDGGKGKSLAILAPKAHGLADTQNYIPALVQGEFVSNFTGYSAMSVMDRENLDKVYAELLSGYYGDDDAAGLDLGHLTATDYVMTGNITKTETGYALQMQITKTADKMTAASYSGNCTFAELDDLTGVRRSSLDILSKMGVQLTAQAQNELSGAAAAHEVQSQTALAQGITAQQSGTIVEAMSYYFQAVSYDSSLTEAASRVNILAANITSGNMDADIRNDIQWRDQWRARLVEAEQVYADYMKQQPLYFLVYDVNLQHGATNYSNNTVPISGVTLDLVPDAAWFNASGGVIRMINVVREGLLATKQAEKWGLDWPRYTVGNSPFGDRDQRFEVTVELVNADGKTIGSERITLRSGYDVEWTGDYNNRSIRLLAPRLRDIQSLGFSRVNAYDITDRLTVRIASIDGVDAEIAAKTKGINILRAAEYARLPEVVAGADSRAVARLRPDIEIDSSGVITGYKGSGGRVVIPANIFGIPVTSIGEEAFTEVVSVDGQPPDEYGNDMNTTYKGKGLTSVVIPNSVTSLGGFAGNQLTSVVIPNSVTVIERLAFSGNQLTSVVIPNSVTSIGYRAFGDNRLTSVVIPNSVTSIGNHAFMRNQLTSVVIPNSVTSLGGFAGNQLTSVVIPDSVTSIGYGAFMRNQLTSVVIPNSVTSMSWYAFSNNQLTSVVIGNSVTSIGAWAFLGNQLTSVVIPDSVTSIEQVAFSNNQLTSVVIGNSVTKIMSSAFSNNQLTSVVIPSNVNIERRAFSADESDEKWVSDGKLISYFEDFYNRNGKKAGTYTRSNVKSKTWRYSP
jgi:hypothetical protein